jgi:hypothetical protein
VAMGVAGGQVQPVARTGVHRTIRERGADPAGEDEDRVACLAPVRGRPPGGALLGAGRLWRGRERGRQTLVGSRGPRPPHPDPLPRTWEREPGGRLCPLFRLRGGAGVRARPHRQARRAVSALRPDPARPGRRRSTGIEPPHPDPLPGRGRGNREEGRVPSPACGRESG